MAQQLNSWTELNVIMDSSHVPTNYAVIVTVSLFKNKGNQADFTNYEPIPFLSYTMNFFERIFNRHLCDIAEISTNL